MKSFTVIQKSCAPMFSTCAFLASKGCADCLFIDQIDRAVKHTKN